MAQTLTAADFVHARFMPHLDLELKCITAVPFELSAFKRLAVLQSEARRLNW